MTIVHSQIFLLYRTYAADFCFVEPPLSDFTCTQTSNIPYMLNFYRPQTKFAKVMFSDVCLSTGERVCVSQHTLGRAVCIPACTGQGGVCIPACTGRGVCLPGRVSARGVSAWGVLPLDQRQTPPPTHPRYYGKRSTSGRYASHRSAFLFTVFFAMHALIFVLKDTLSQLLTR